MMLRSYGAFRSRARLAVPGASGICAAQHGRACVPNLQKAVASRAHATVSEALSTAPDPADAFLHGGAAAYIDEMYSSWKVAPDSVHVSWRTYFRNMEDRRFPASQAFQPPPGLISSRQTKGTPSLSVSQMTEMAIQPKVQKLVTAYQSHGHYRAKIDPLGLKSSAQTNPRELDPAFHGLTEADMNQAVTLGPEILPGMITDQRKTMTLREVIAASEEMYCGNYSAEILHISDGKRRDWLRQRLEVPNAVAFTFDEKRRILDSLLRATALERFLASKFPNDKRFGLDGSESLAPGIDALLNRSTDVHGIESFVVGSCHRGRLTMLSSVWGKPTEDLFAEFAGRVRSDLRGMVGDVKYHHGYDGERTSAGGRQVAVSVLANPSHLEAVDPVATGQTHATQRLHNGGKDKVMCVALHGDAAIAGQGVVYETLGLSQLDAYNVGGTVRVVVNNQVGFTTEVHHSRSTPYASDVAKYIDAPVFHVNGNDVEAVVFVCQLAADWRAEFGTDCIVDIVSYRRFGHNELDQPSFTQPLMYQSIKAQKPTLELYIDQLVEEGSFAREEIEAQKAWFQERLESMFTTSKSVTSTRTNFSPAWKSLPTPEEASSQVLALSEPTGVEEKVLQRIGDQITTIPEGFNPHSNLRRILSSRRDAISSDVIDWTTAEAMAFGTLSLEGHPIRLTGQDVQRGTFSQRHAVLHDQVTGRTYMPLNNMEESQGSITIENSPLSEFGVLGFEYGVSLADPMSLVMWEAQFGDFANNAQVIIDNFIAAGQAKWLDRSGVVLSLPHGYDGQGAEHSSARLERFLMLCGEEGRVWPENLERGPQDANMSVVYPTTPANYFHLLRRQQKRKFRRPLVIFFSKSLLRHPLTRSTMAELSGTSTFQPVLEDPLYKQPEDSSVSRIILCTGQVHATLHKHRETHGVEGCAITRIEEMHPFPWAEVKASLDKYPNATSIVWAQEEHYNGGAWHYVRDRLETVLGKTKHHQGKKLLYAGRAASASTAAGLKSANAAEEEQLLKDAHSVEA